MKETSSSMDYTHYQSPFTVRYASEAMSKIFSLQHKHEVWRQIWIALARAEKDLGLPITNDQIEELQKHKNSIDFSNVEKHEKKLKHDVMAHISAYAEQCPAAGPILHLGATSCTITDNADLLVMREALALLEQKLKTLLQHFSTVALRYKDLPTLSYTHFQAAQPTTVGKRISLWMQDFYLDYLDLSHRQKNLSFLGLKGTTGTQASFMELLGGDVSKVKKLEEKFAKYLDFEHYLPLSGQTYTRKIDKQLLEVLSGIAVSAHKMSTDLRLLAHLKEIEEPFGSGQVGSSAMPYKRNPIENERICSLSRYIMTLEGSASITASTQWLERSLDDSAIRRLTLPEAFLAADSILDLSIGIIKDLVVYPKVIEKNLKEEIPFIATENILMASVKKGGDRQKIHEKLALHAQEVASHIKISGDQNDLIERLSKDPSILLSKEEIDQILDGDNFTGAAAEQVEEFIQNYIKPLFSK